MRELLRKPAFLWTLAGIIFSTAIGVGVEMMGWWQEWAFHVGVIVLVVGILLSFAIAYLGYAQYRHQSQTKQASDGEIHLTKTMRLVEKIPQALRDIDREMELSVKSCAFKSTKKLLKALVQKILANINERKADEDYQRGILFSKWYEYDVTNSEAAFALDGSGIGLGNLIDNNHKLKELWDTLKEALDAIQNVTLKTRVELYKMVLYNWHSSKQLLKYLGGASIDGAKYERTRNEIDWRLSKIMSDINRGIKDYHDNCKRDTREADERVA